MAYAIIINNQIYKIASNEQEKNDLNVSENSVTIEISDSDFTKIKNNTGAISIVDNNITVTDDGSRGVIETAEILQNYIDNLKIVLKDFIDAGNSNKSILTQVNNYYNALVSFDTTSISYPLNITWEEYCAQNSIPYINTLQIP